MRILALVLVFSVAPFIVFGDEPAGLRHLPSDFMVFCQVMIGPGMYIVCLDDRAEICQRVIVRHGVVHGGEYLMCGDLVKGS